MRSLSKLRQLALTERIPCLWRALGQRGVESRSLADVDTIPLEKEPYCRQRSELVLGDRVPVLAPDAFVAPSAVLIGDVDLYNKVERRTVFLLEIDLLGVHLGRLCFERRFESYPRFEFFEYSRSNGHSCSTEHSYRTIGSDKHRRICHNWTQLYDSFLQNWGPVCDRRKISAHGRKRRG